MRVAFIGASATAVGAAKILVKGDHEVILVDIDKDKIKDLADDLDCGLIEGDGSKPGILRELDPEDTDFLVCLTNNDETNILATLVGRSLGFRRIVTKIEEPEFEHICIELGLDNVIIPSREAAQHLADLAAGDLPKDLRHFFKAGARLFSFVAGEGDAGRLDKLALPARTRLMCVYRNGKLIDPDSDVVIRAGDEVVLFTQEKSLPQLKERWAKQRADRRRPAS